MLVGSTVAALLHVLHYVMYVDVTGSRVHTGPRMPDVVCMVKETYGITYGMRDYVTASQ